MKRRSLLLVMGVMAAGMANAAKISWSISSGAVFGSDETRSLKGENVVGYLILAEHALDSTTTFSLANYADAAALAADIGKVKSLGALGSKVTDSGTTEAATVPHAQTSSLFTFNSGDQYVLMLAYTDASDGRVYYNISDAIRLTQTYTRTDSVSLEFEFNPAVLAGVQDSVSVSGGWTVPEPGSGLLMLVGAAMLALRRKRSC